MISNTLFALVAALFAAPPRPPAPPPARPLPSLPSVARVRVEAAKDHLLVIHEIDLPRGDWRSGDLDLFVAFGAPGTPIALDAHLLSVADGELEPGETDVGEPIAVDRAPRRPASAQLLLGRPQMAGAVLHVKEPAFRRAVSAGNMAAIRIRTLLPLPQEADKSHDVVVRLGIAQGPPLTVGRLQLVSLEPAPWIARAGARLCGSEADPYPLAIALLPRTSPAPPAAIPGPIAPVLAVRHASDDLCIRFWTQ